VAGLEKHVPKHSPLRNYYMFRNTVWMFFQKTTPWRWICINSQRLCVFFIFFACLVPPRKQRLRMMWRGLCDGFKQHHQG
jgi:rhamnosyltransferase